MAEGEQPGSVNADAFIASAIKLGERDGVAALDADQRLVYLISEAEVHCDMNGIDAFLDRYCPLWMAEAGDAFAAIGATEIAAALKKITPDTPYEDPLLHRLNDLITKRSGYDYEAISNEIERRLARRSAES